MNKDDERVLVFPTARLHEAGMFQGFDERVEHYLPQLLDPRYLSYRRRGDVEGDPSFKQIIPYVVLQHGDTLFYYTRGKAGSEARLRSLRSVGIGGHIAEEDHCDGAHPYRKGMLREVVEEVDLQSDYADRCVGLINDDRTPVGQVHLGIVHVFALREPKVKRREEAIAEAGFAPLADLRNKASEFETWSQFVLEMLAS